MTTDLQRFIDLRETLAADRAGYGGAALCAVLTEALDTAVAELAGGLPAGIAIVALGGYGRGEQCLHSDVDVMVLYEGTDPEPAVRAVLYPLWDARLKVGHAVRTPAECRDAATDAFDTLTSLLDARHVAGDADLVDRLREIITEVVRRRPLAPHIVSEERRRRAVDPYPTMAADLKDGRGGLRTHQGARWERRRAGLLGLLVDAPTDEERAAYETLLAVRNALHAAAGRAVDRFVTDLREPAAHWLGSDVLTTAARLTAALDVGERLADRRWPDLHAEQDRLVGLGRRVFSSLRSRFSPAEPSSRDDDSVPAIAVRAAGRVDGARLTGDEERLVACAAPTPWSVADRNHLLTLLSAGTRGRAIFDRLRELGWVERELPEWTVVATAPQIAPFHDHPVGPHLWRTVDEVLAIASSRDELAEIAAELGSTEELVLAAFLHDIGKAHGGEHEVVGAGLAADILQRLGFGPATTGVVVDVVRNHLLLSETATRRDIADLTVIGDVAARIGDRRRLDVLYLVTVADLRATGTSTWNEWRATLLRILYERTRQAMAIGVAPPATADIDAILAVAAPETSRRAVEEHVAAMPPDYLDTASPGQVMSHIRAAAELSGPVSISSDASDPGLVLVSGADRTGFLLAVTRAFAAHGIGVVDARLRTRDDGIALDTFRVRDDVGGGSVDGERWPAVEMAIEAALTGADDLRPAVRRRAHHYDTAGSRGGAPTLRITARRSGPHTAVEVRAQDRIGLLAEIVEALGAEGLDIHLAKIDTLGGEARDVFHVRRSGAPIVVEAERDALCRRIRDRLSR